MSDEGEKTCPLCAEEMDLTDQQLRPCKCGYEICVWCFHHIMDMAEKDNTDGRCPACRTRYNKEKIVGTASKCERLVTGMSVEKKQKSQKGRTKTLEGKKQLGSVRVIQRNLVYIVGLPLNLADEDLLQQKEYFGQYGKVLKVSISRTATGAIQQFANSTCSVYITYSKEEEAVRSIQSAHGFVLEGRTLRACFGTTKYCHAWLRNAPCTNADCLYLHEFGPQEDSFTKDEIISAYTRNRVQQITGATNEMERRSGNILPPPADDFSINKSTSSWPKPISKITTNNPAIGIKVPPTNSSNGKSVALPAAASCGTRTSNSQLSSKEATNQQADVSTPTPSFSSTVVSPLSNGDESVKEKGSLGNPVSIKENRGGTDKNISRSSEIHHPDPVLDEAERRICPLSVDMSSNISNQKRLQACESEQFLEPLTTNETETTSKQSDLVSDLQKKVAISEAEQDDMLSFNDQRLRDTEVTQNNSTGFNRLHAHASANGGLHPPSSLHANNIPVVKGYSSDVISNSSREVSNGHTYFHGTEGRKSQKGGLDLGESSIISNILSMDFDPWDESLTSPRNLAKFLGESDKQVESNRVLNLRKAQNSNQSRFSFARQDEGTDNYGDFGAEYKNFRSDFVSNNSVFVDNKLSNGNGFSSFSYGESENFSTNYFSMNENKISVSRAQVSAPPGFSGPNRAPPPGFGSQERMEQTFDNLSGNHMLDACSLLGKSHQTAAPVNMGGGGDIEFMDPAILAVGGRVNTQLNSIENDIRLQLLMQTSFSQQQIQNPRFSQLGLNYPQQTTDSYGISSRMFENNLSSHQQPISSSVSNAHWNEFQNGNDIRNQRLGFNTYYHEDAKFQMPMPMPTSGHLYNRTFGI